jgi:hypothetical protein
VWFLSGLAMTVAGPFGTFDTLDLAGRASFWFVAIAAGIAICSLQRLCFRRIFPDQSFFQATVLYSGVFTAIYAPLLIWFIEWFSKGELTGTLADWQIALIIFFIPFVINSLLFKRRESRLASRVNTQPNQGSRLLSRLGLPPDEPLCRLQVRDHYVDVFTEGTSQSLLMRFADAIEEIDKSIGLRVHRSHWVAKDAIRQVEKEQGRIFLRLMCGTRIPVSRKYVKDLKAAGVL